MKPLRILEIGHSYAVRLNRSIPAAEARLGGVELTVAAPAFFHGDLRPLTLEGEPGPSPYRLVSLPTRLSRWIHIFWYDWRALTTLVRDGRFDVVYAWQEPYILAGYEIAQALEKTPSRFIFRTAQSLVKRYPPPFNHFERSVLARAQGWVAGGELVRQAMLAKGFPEATSRILPLAVDPEEFRPADEAQKMRVRDGLGLQGPVIGFVGRLVPQKGISLLLQALEQVRGHFSVVFLGSGPLESMIHTWARRNNLSSRVRVLLAKHVEVPKYISAFDLLVAPSQTTPQWREQFGRMVIEAFACRVPVLVSDSGEPPFVVGEAGRVLPEHDAKAWADAISALLESPGERARLGEAGYARCLSRYTPQVVAKQRLAFYREILDRRGFAG